LIAGAEKSKNSESKVNGVTLNGEENNNARQVNGDIQENAEEKSDGAATTSTTTNANADKKEEQEVVFIQDMGFTVKIVSPGLDPFDIQVSQPF